MIARHLRRAIFLAQESLKNHRSPFHVFWKNLLKIVARDKWTPYEKSFFNIFQRVELALKNVFVLPSGDLLGTMSLCLPIAYEGRVSESAASRSQPPG